MTSFRIASPKAGILPVGATECDAVVLVTAVGSTTTTLDGEYETGGAELLIVDTSKSMQGPRLTAAQEALAQAIERIPDGARFGVIRGDDTARMAFPRGRRLAVSSERARAKAKVAVAKLAAGGASAAVGSWIDLAAKLLQRERGIHHVVVLSDLDEEGNGAELDRALAAARGRFVLDYRVFDSEVASAITFFKLFHAGLGSVNGVGDAGGFAGDFTDMMKVARRKMFDDVSFRVWTPNGAEVTRLQQVRPSIVDLTGRRTDQGPGACEYAVGPWGDEDREYRITVRIDFDHASRSRRLAHLEEVYPWLSTGLTPNQVDSLVDAGRIIAARVTLLVDGAVVEDGHAGATGVCAISAGPPTDRPTGGVREPRTTPPRGPSTAVHLDLP